MSFAYGSCLSEQEEVCLETWCSCHPCADLVVWKLTWAWWRLGSLFICPSIIPAALFFLPLCSNICFLQLITPCFATSLESAWYHLILCSNEICGYDLWVPQLECKCSKVKEMFSNDGNYSHLGVHQSTFIFFQHKLSPSLFTSCERAREVREVCDLFVCNPSAFKEWKQVFRFMIDSFCFCFVASPITPSHFSHTSIALSAVRCSGHNRYLIVFVDWY